MYGPPLKRPFTEQSATEADLGPGNVAYDEQGSKYIKVLASEAIADSACCVLTTTTAVLNDGFYVMDVEEADALNEEHLIVGWNNTGSAITSGNYFWCKTGPIVLALCEASVDIGDPVYTEVTAGLVDDVGTIAAGVAGIAITDGAGGTCYVFTDKGV